MLVEVSYVDNSYKNVLTNVFIINLLLLYTSNFLVAIVGTYFLPKLLQQGLSYCRTTTNSLSPREFCELFWAAVIICALINFACSAYSYAYFFLLCNNCHCTSQTQIILRFYLPPTLIILLAETISIWIRVKNLKIVGSVCCCFNRHLVRAIHTLGVCHILWCLHRVVCSLLVAIFFVALAPAQTLAAISLIYFVILSAIVYLTFNLHYLRKIKCPGKSSVKLVCKLLVISLLYLLTIGFLFLLTLLFNTLAENGLTSSGLGSVILSLVAPTIVFVVTLKLKQHLNKYFPQPTSISSSESKDDIGEDTFELMEELVAYVPFFDNTRCH